MHPGDPVDCRTLLLLCPPLQAGQGFLDRALQHRTSRLDATASAVLRGWHAAAHLRGIKQGKARRAVAHWMGSRLAIGFYAWHACKQLALVKKAKGRAALMMWARGSLGRAFDGWHGHASTRALWHRKGRAYQALLLGRSAAFALFMLRANAARKRRSSGARLHRRRATLGKALLGWRFRVAMGDELEHRLLLVFRKVSALLSPSFLFPSLLHCGFIPPRILKNLKPIRQYLYNVLYILPPPDFSMTMS